MIDEGSLLEEGYGKRLLVLGASGQAGRKILTRALSENYRITATARDISTIPRIEKVTAVRLDILNAGHSELVDLIQGHTAVVFALGPNNFGSTKIYSHGVKKVREAMEDAKVFRLIVISMDYENPQAGFCFRAFISKILLRGVINDLQAMEFDLKSYSRTSPAPVKFTVIKHFRLYNEGLTVSYKAVRLGKRHKVNWKFRTSLDDIADFILKELQENKFVNKYVCVGS